MKHANGFERTDSMMEWIKRLISQFIWLGNSKHKRKLTIKHQLGMHDKWCARYTIFFPLLFFCFSCKLPVKSIEAHWFLLYIHFITFFFCSSHCKHYHRLHPVSNGAWADCKSRRFNSLNRENQHKYAMWSGIGFHTFFFFCAHLWIDFSTLIIISLSEKNAQFFFLQSSEHFHISTFPSGFYFWYLKWLRENAIAKKKK